VESPPGDRGRLEPGGIEIIVGEGTPQKPVNLFTDNEARRKTQTGPRRNGGWGREQRKWGVEKDRLVSDGHDLSKEQENTTRIKGGCQWIVVHGEKATP